MALGRRLWCDVSGPKLVLTNPSLAGSRLAACIGASQNSSLAADLLDLTNPRHDFVALAGGMGVPARRAMTAE
jgi:hypothetical protein